ncbi:hypothetical protein [uncultured Nostoc sp.]|uniref:hypothetical protein n=1 Tax=uncultured Nostoc sp. TaxID=340711 RepID=UPI0035C956DC
MFFPGSRYEKVGTYQLTRPNGTLITVTKVPLPSNQALLGYHRRLEGQRLDLIANNYLKDATAFWQLCDGNNAVVPDALAAHDLIGIPAKGS